MPLILSLLILMLGAAGLWAQQERPARHPFSARDMLAMDRISDPQLSPDGGWVVFVVSRPDLEANRSRTDLWMVKSDGSGLRRLTADDASDYNPRWSPDGALIWFLSTRSGSSQIWRIAPDGGEAEQASDLPLDVSNLTVSPDGSRLAFTLKIFSDCPDLACTAERLAGASGKPGGQVYDDLFLRHWDVWEDGLRSHLFTLSIESSEPSAPSPRPDPSASQPIRSSRLFVPPATAGDVVNVMKGMESDTPSEPFGGPEEIAFSRDGRWLVFTAKNPASPEAWSTNYDLYATRADGAGSPRNLTEANQAWDTAPVFSPDGKTLAYLAMARPGYEADRFQIMLLDWPSGSARSLSPSWDRSPGALAWSADGRSLLAGAAHLGQGALFRIELSGPRAGEGQLIWDKGYVGQFQAGSRHLFFTKDDLASPAELYRTELDGSAPLALTDFNREVLSKVVMGEYEQFQFAGWNGETVHAYAVKPSLFESGKKYPVAFLIHGGPQGSFSNHFHYRWNPQVYAGAGYAAVMVDFHGSVGYGQAFTDSIRRDWGGKPLEDLQKGLQEALRRYPWMDGQRVAALGASYGGYMVNWIAGNWPDRFRCLVNHDGVFDLRSMYYSTEELWFPEWEFGGAYYENAESYERHNPVRYVENWKTPMLVIHGALDYRVPLEQGIAAYTALQRRGVPSRFLYFPEENHWVLRPLNSLQWHDTVLGWLKRWLE